MKTIKFACLILMCATSSLALVLPALGVVSFPQQLIRSEDLIRSSSSSAPENPILQDNRNWQPASENNGTNFSPQPGGTNPYGSPSGYGPANTMQVPPPPQPNGAYGLPISSNVPAGNGYPTPNSVNGTFPDSTSPTLDGIGIAGVPNNIEQSARHKFGTGIWLLLGPVWIASLAIWSIAPSSSGSFKKR